MAGEIKGVLCEVITHCALQQVLQWLDTPTKVYWNEKLEALSVRSDLFLAEDPKAPTHFLLVTSGGSTKESEKKFWRDLNEWMEIKSHIPGMPIVLMLSFHTSGKPALANLNASLYDAVHFIAPQPYAPTLYKWLQQPVQNFPKQRQPKLRMLQKAIRRSPKLSRAIQALAQDLHTLLSQKNNRFQSLWSLLQQEEASPWPLPIAQPTSIRRGVGKLMVLESSIRTRLYQQHTSSTPIQWKESTNYPFTLQFLQKTLRTTRLIDSDIQLALNQLGTELCERILQRTPQAMQRWIQPLRQLHEIKEQVQFVKEHYQEVIKAASLKKLLKRCYRDPALLTGKTYSSTVWLFQILITLLKAHSGKAQGYGSASLAQDTQMPELLAGLYGVVITPFVQRQKPLTDKQMTQLAKGLAKRFAREITQETLESLHHTAVQWAIKEHLEQRLLPYRHFEPLRWLLEETLTRYAIPFSPKNNDNGWLTTYAGMHKKRATTPFIRVGKILIHWKSSHVGHTNDKTKELCARARNTRYQYCIKDEVFKRRMDVEQLVLIIDGDWTQRNLRTLYQAGWHGIFYPHELEGLAKYLQE